MKYLFLLLVALLIIWAFKRGRGTSRSAPPSTTKDPAPFEMVSCAQCGIHLPQQEAVLGAKGLYCCTEHRAAAQDRNPS